MIIKSIHDNNYNNNNNNNNNNSSERLNAIVNNYGRIKGLAVIETKL